MRQSAIATFALAVSSIAVGCAAPMENDEAPSEVTGQAQQLTVDECAAQQSSCFSKNPLFGLFTCPAQYTQCVATAQDGIPAEVASAAAAAAECNAQAASCVSDTPAKVASCASARAECIADIVGVELPPVVDGTAGCVDATVACIDGAKRASGLVSCAENLTECAVDQARGVIDQTVGPVLEGANKCRIEFRSCVDGAETAAAIAECTADNALCVAEIFDVKLPNVPLEDVADCAESATQCAFDASRASDVVACAEKLSACAGQVIEDTTNVPAQLTCEQKWTACVAKDPLFGFITCGGQLASCQD